MRGDWFCGIRMKEYTADIFMTSTIRSVSTSRNEKEWKRMWKKKKVDELVVGGARITENGRLDFPSRLPFCPDRIVELGSVYSGNLDISERKWKNMGGYKPGHRKM